MKFTRFDQFIMFSELDELYNWLAGRGIKQRNRLRIYRENLIEMRDREKNEDVADIFAEIQKAGRLTEILASYVEGFEIVDALTSLRSAQVEIPDELLKRALDGAADASRESPKNNQGRNAMFELSIGAMFARQNLQPRLSIANPDVEFEFEGRRVLVQCKRVLAENRVLRVISEGIRQLRKQVDASLSDVGLVAVNISRVFYRGDGHWEVPANSDVHAVLSEMIRSFIKSNDDSILRKRDPAAMAALFYAAAPFRIEGLGYTPARGGTLCPFDLGSNEFLARLASLAKL
jgi:hypothetical protein